jgi:hypothetical protein
MNADEFLVAVHAHTHENIRFADAKALAFIAINSGVIAGLFGKDMLLLEFTTPHGAFESVMSLLTFGFLAVGVVFCAAVVWPRGIAIEDGIDGGKLTIPSKIASTHLTAGDYAKCVDVAASEGKLTHDLAALLFARAKVNQKKFSLLRTAIVLSAVGLVLAGLFVLILTSMHHSGI